MRSHKSSLSFLGRNPNPKFSAKPPNSPSPAVPFDGSRLWEAYDGCNKSWRLGYVRPGPMAAAHPMPVATLLLRGWRTLVLASVKSISEKSRTTSWIRQEQEDIGRIGMGNKLTVGSAVQVGLTLTSRKWRWRSQFQKAWGLSLIPCETLGLKNFNVAGENFQCNAHI